MTHKEALEIIVYALELCDPDRVELALSLAKQLLVEKPVAYFLYDGEMYSQISEKYKTDSDVFPLYTKEVTK